MYCSVKWFPSVSMCSSLFTPCDRILYNTLCVWQKAASDSLAVPCLLRCSPLTHFIPDSGELQGQFPLLHNGTLALKRKDMRSLIDENCKDQNSKNTPEPPNKSCSTVVKLSEGRRQSFDRWTQNESSEAKRRGEHQLSSFNLSLVQDTLTWHGSSHSSLIND